MSKPIDDLRIQQIRPLLSPAILREETPLGEPAAAHVAASREVVARIIHGHDPRLLAVVGPCSIHDVTAAVEYAGKLAEEARRLGDRLYIVMRVYFEKPRTVMGWKGLINDPHLDGSFAINEGLRLARRLLVDVVELGVPAGTEFLDTTCGQFYSDVVSWGAIGARTAESQIHRELASGLSMPVGIKNRTDGDIQVAVDAIRAAQHRHLFPSLTKEGAAAILETTGNEDCHLVLRGGSATGPNYGPEAVAAAAAKLRKARLPEVVMVDCSHGNSEKKAPRQAVVAESVAEQIEAGDQTIRGVMIESHLQGGRQDLENGRPLAFGQSITDACLGWQQTVPVLERLAKAIESRQHCRCPEPADEQVAGAMESLAILKPPSQDGVPIKGVAIANKPEDIARRCPRFPERFYIVHRHAWRGPNRSPLADILLVEDLKYWKSIQRRHPGKILLDIGPADFIDLDRFRPLDDPPQYDGLQIARWNRFKRHELLLGAAAAAPSLRFLVFGHFANNGDAEELQLVRQLEGIWPANVVNPYRDAASNQALDLTPAGVNRWINQCRLGILTSKAEGINRFKMECLAANRPILVAADTSSPTRKHVNEQTGAFFKPTAAGLLDAIRSALSRLDTFQPRQYVQQHTGKPIALGKLKEALCQLCRRDGVPFVFDDIQWDGRGESQHWGEQVYRALEAL